ncbi:hypothetical protein E5A73_03170 [Sphingomonas gei]|uniref:Uncharacterized protein n=1 Tax=Sphingomonas gei TaxID=1395960 RepID=A0A4S1XJ89_9SPHN|nr:hypothetical protein [Sphingomonas gei]TGX56117.1 hypothetical protein E5A73_03170 [Sphingomonas gei]
MRDTLISCVVLCALSCPALAGERSGAGSRPIAIAELVKDPAARRIPEPAVDKTLPQRFMLPAGNARLERLPEASLIVERRVAKTLVVDSETPPEVTARAGGRYAVYDILREQPRPRHRNSPLSAAFVLKIDGSDDSPPFSVGGGGVAAAVWQAVPK